MEVKIEQDAQSLGVAAGKKGAELIRQTINNNGAANVLLATGASQFETINQLILEKEIDWSKVNMFHLDEYVNLPVTHKASFRKYLQERFLDKVGPLLSAHLINGEGDPEEECQRLSSLINNSPIDVAFIGIGENGHLAFNDPPADFETSKPYIVVDLDQACRQQQVNEDWFENLEEVPKQAISISIKQVMASKYIVGSIPDARKAKAVKDTLECPVSNMRPATILQNHSNCFLYLDELSASLLS